MPVEEKAAADQPAATPTDNSPMLDDSLPADTPAEETPETQGAEEAEGEESTEAAETEGQEESAEGETETESTDEFLASLTPEELAYYAKRYPTLYKAYQDPNQPADLRQAFIDRVNQDHAYAALRDGAEEEEEGEPTSEESAETAQPADRTQARTQYYSQIDEVVKTLDQQSLAEMGSNMLEAMGVDIKSTEPEIAALVKNAPKLGQVLARGAIDLIATTLPNLLSSRMEMVMPGITELYQNSLATTTWEKQRNFSTKGPDGQVHKPYEKLPAYGTTQFNTAVDKLLKEMPELRGMFANLPYHEKTKQQAALLAKLLTAGQANPAIVAQAVETGKKLADKAKVTRTAGKALGAGRSAQQLGNQAEEDQVMADLDAAIARANADLSPLSSKR